MIGQCTMSELSRSAAMPAAGQLPDMVLRSWMAPPPARELGTMASWRGISTAWPWPKSRKACSIAAMQSGILSRGSISSFVRMITLPTLHVVDQVVGQLASQVASQGGQASDRAAVLAGRKPERNRRNDSVYKRGG